MTGGPGIRCLALCALLALILAGCGSSLTSSTSEASISGLRTDPDDQGLVVSYIGGSCDTSARLDISESAGAVQLRVLTVVTDGTCDAAGHLRTVSGRLATPLGTRTVLSGRQQLIPFPGARVLRPTTSERKLRVTLEQGSTDQSDDPAHGLDSGPQTTNRWSTTFSDSGNSCPVVTVSQNLTTTDYSHPGSVAEGTRKIGGVTAHLYRDGNSDADALQWTLGWAQEGETVEVSSSGSCAGAPLIGPDEIVKIAASLRAP